VPLTSLQRRIFRILATLRDPESFIAGSTYLTRRGDRISDDIDIFHDREERVAQAAATDTAALQAAGLDVTWQRREPLFYQALITADGAATRLEWVVDSDFRFYPAQPDPEFGYVLHPADLATNKMMAAAGRREARDIVDLVSIHRDILPLGAVAAATVGRSLGFTPEALINEVRRFARYTEADFARLSSESPIDGAATMKQLRLALDEADRFVRRLPTDKLGLLFLQDGQPVQPDPDRLQTYPTHSGAHQGHWPSSAEIGSAMMERYRQPE
jgi:hypothetical protein